MAKILIVEDNPDIHALISESLALAGHETVCAYSGTEADLLLKMNDDIDLILLDLMLPGMSGEDLLSKIRQTSDQPVIVISAKDAIDSKVQVLEMGADDYMVKPFDLKELQARIQVQLKKRTPSASESLEAGGLVLDSVNNLVTYEGKEVKLTRQEWRIMELLLKHPQKIFTKQEIFEYAWQDYFMGDDKTINVHISNIRKKLLDQTGKDWIETVWGVGFRLDPDQLSS